MIRLILDTAGCPGPQIPHLYICTHRLPRRCPRLIQQLERVKRCIPESIAKNLELHVFNQTQTSVEFRETGRAARAVAYKYSVGK
jgi:hypothetical protein